MSDTNYVILEGRLVRDPDLRKTPSGVSVCDIHIASNRYTPKPPSDTGELQFRQHTTFAKVTLWNEKADKFSDVLHKGDRILVVGKLVDDNYKLKGQDAETRGRLKIDNVERITVVKRTTT